MYWNVGRRHDLGEVVVDLADAHDVDVVILGENQQPSAELADALTARRGRAWRYSPPPTASRSDVFTSLPSIGFAGVASYHGGRLTLHALHHTTPEILLGCVHLVDARNYSPAEQFDEARTVATRLREAEQTYGRERTILIGDFNMAPYADGMVGGTAFNAVMCSKVATRGLRSVGDDKVPYFYNPMWSFLGDQTPGPPGTFYYSKGRFTSYWHMLDQVLIRPALLTTARLNVTILGSDRLVTERGRPDKVRASDHLPILVALEVT